MIYWDKVDTTKGECIILATEKGICWVGSPGTTLVKGIEWVKKHLRAEKIIENGKLSVLKKAADELRKYFKGHLKRFSVPLNLYGTAFQMAVWRQLQQIPYGKTRSYKEIAQAIGRPAAVRAVGSACGANPLSIIVPCHRVIANGGSLGGYGGGLSTKKWLLSLEKIAL